MAKDNKGTPAPDAGEQVQVQEPEDTQAAVATTEPETAPGIAVVDTELDPKTEATEQQLAAEVDELVEPDPDDDEPGDTPSEEESLVELKREPKFEQPAAVTSSNNAAWAIGAGFAALLLALVVGISMNNSLAEKFSGETSSIKSDLAAVSDAVNGHSGQLNELSGRTGRLEGKTEALEGSVKGLASEVAEVRTATAANTDAIGRVDTKVDSLSTKVDALPNALADALEAREAKKAEAAKAAEAEPEKPSTPSADERVGAITENAEALKAELDVANARIGELESRSPDEDLRLQLEDERVARERAERLRTVPVQP